MPYLGKQSEQVGVSIQKYEFLQATDPSSGTTSFSVPSDAGDHVNVWLNGVLLVEGGSDDYSKSNTAVTFNSAPADGDIIRIDVVESFALPDALKSSGDTMTGALKLNGGIQQQTSADLSGTYAYHQLMLSDAFTVTGDVTISDNLVLAKLSDDSNAVTLTNDTSTRTITGTGSLESSTLAQTPNQSLTGMTGTIGSGVTNNAGVASGTVGGATVINTSGDITTTGAFTSVGIDDNATATAMTIKPSAITTGRVNVAIGTTANQGVGAGGTQYKVVNIIGEEENGTALAIQNDGNTNGKYGLGIMCGKDDASGTNYAISFEDGDGGDQGYITFTSGTVSYGAFTASHDAELPEEDNENGYPYGTLVDTSDIFYKQKDGANTERGIQYKVQKTSSAYSKAVLGTYCSKHTNPKYANLHQINILGDGHILCNGEKGNILIGDGICTSSTAGEGMKADKMAMIIGIAQENVTFSGSETKLVAVQYGLQQFTPWDD